DNLLKEMQRDRNNMPLLVDEYGATAGLVTIEDVLEKIVGEIADEKDVEVAGVQAQPDGSYLVEGRVTLRDLNRQFGWELDDEEVTTVAGLVIHKAGRIPEVGHHVDVGGLRLDVLRRSGHQVTLLRIRRTVRSDAG
ncbi:MAG: hypothetical protein KDE35_10280, partial [Geminicoccaceae bacterium]|nr:hypothetical protein [Geminicoccaceae bacterium]